MIRDRAILQFRNFAMSQCRHLAISNESQVQASQIKKFSGYRAPKIFF
jgi:hypothetical protein